MSNVRDFEADRAICDAATSGEWRVYGGKFGETNVYAPPYEKANEVVSDISWDRPADATFIAEARTGWPAALDFIHTQADEIERLSFEYNVVVGGFRQQVELAGELIVENTKLRTENQRYRQALESIANAGPHVYVRQMAKEALAHAENVR